MQILKKNGIILFWMVLFLDSFFVYQQNLNFHFYTKILLMPILMAYIFLNSRKNRFQRSKMLIFLGLTFAWIGDILLTQTGDTFFALGMVAFLGTHIFYSIFFYRVQPIASTTNYETVIVALIILTGLYAAMYNFMKLDIAAFPHFEIPVYIYAISIGIMAVFAANILSNRGKRNMAIQFFIPGAILFIISDATIAIHKFKYVDMEFLGVIVMMTYGYAQCMLAQGFARYLKG
jgi:uncharacterized membrane protein YhhN